MKRTQQQENELTFTKEVLCAMIEQAYRDIKCETKFLRSNAQNHADQQKQTAIHFFKSKLFKELAEALNIRADRILTRAFK